MICASCETTIFSYPCPCGYTDTAKPSRGYPRSTYQPQPTGITKEEFGLNLYETIKTIGGILGIDQQRANAIHKGEGYRVQELMTRRKALQVTLAKQLPELTDSEMDQVLARYPFVTGY